MIARWPLVGVALLIASGCTDLDPEVSFAYDASLALRLTEKKAGWPAACDRAPGERISLPLLLHRESKQRPLPPGFVQDLTAAVQALPRPFARLFKRHVCAVVPMHDSPMTATLHALEEDRTLSIILMNVQKMSLPPNEWLAFKESTAFEDVPDRLIVAKMAEVGENTRRTLMEFVLMHELGHVVDAAFPDHLLIEGFKRISWPRQDALAKTPLHHYPERYQSPPLADRHIEAYYDLIAAGAFASPATVSNEKEDFADSLATFMHTVVLGRPWELEVHRGGKLVRKLNSCWAEARCREKRELLETLLQRWDSP